MKKRILSLLICVALCLTLLPATALAAGGTYLALGDSITTGYAPGNTTVASPFAGQVQAMGGYASLSNRAAEGETTQTLKDKLPGLRSDIAGASLITITIGGNDLMDALYGYLVESYNTNNPTKPITLESLKAALMDLSQLGNQLMLMQVISYIGGFDGSSAETDALNTFEANLGQIIDQIRQENPSAPIVIATQYNPYRHITDQSAQGIVAAFETGVVHLNEWLTKVAGAKGLPVADVYTAFRDDGGQLTNAAFSMSDLKNASLDFHPNQAGHDKIAAVIYGALPDNSSQAIMLGTSGIKDPTENTDTQGKFYTPNSYIYFGVNGSDPIKWRVLDADKANDKSTDGMFLLSEYLLGGGVSFDIDKAPNAGQTNPNEWQHSDAQAWCSEFASNLSNFTTAEQNAMLGVAKIDNAGNIYGTDWGESSLTDADKMFFLSVWELADYVGDYSGAPEMKATYVDGSADMWWLCLPSKFITNFVGTIGSDGKMYGSVVQSALAARPAFNLNLNSILFTSAAAGGKPEGKLQAISDYKGDEWKLTLLDSSRNFSISDATTNSSGDTIAFSYSDAQTGTNEYISVMIEDNGSITHYGRILQLDGTTNGANGTASFTLPAGVTLDNDTKLYVFNEQYNGDYHTDYAGQRIEVVNPTVDDTAPTLSNGSATRDSETNATVKFTSDEAGTCYYIAQDTELKLTNTEIAAQGTPQACKVGENEIKLGNITTASAQYVAVVAKDAVGNVSNILNVTIPAYVAPAYGISADTTVLNFGTVTEGYEAPAEQTVTVTNTGNQPVTLTQPMDTASFTVGDLSSTELAVGETATVTVRPNTGLAAGTYNETLTVSNDSYTVRADVALRFTVTQQGGGGSSGGSGGSSGSGNYGITVSRPAHGTVKLSHSAAVSGAAVTITVIPDEGYQLDTLTVTDSKGNELKLTEKGGGQYTFVMPSGAVTVKAVFTELEATPEPLPFMDVAETAWYADAVRYVYEHDLMNGTDTDQFSPDSTTSRSMIATILWRMAGSPVVNYTMDFSDVAQGQWYSEAIRWAASEGIVGGYGNGAFGTDDPITREQFAVMLYRFAQKQGYDVSVGENTNILSYTDAFDVAEYAIPAMQWACGAGILNGSGANLNPQGDATRAQAAAMLMRFCEEVVTW